MKSLPEINVLPVHNLKLLVMDKDISFSPFNVQQEKALLVALEENITDDIIRNYENILNSCLNDKIDWESLSVVDYLTLIINIRAKSKGENIELTKKECKKCKKPFDISINVEDSLKYGNVDNKKDIIKIADKLSFELSPLNYKFLYGLEKIQDEMDMYIHTAKHCISKVFWGNDIYKPSPDELAEKVIKNLRRYDLEEIFKKCGELINIYMDIEYVCPFCDEKENMVMYDFLK